MKSAIIAIVIILITALVAYFTKKSQRDEMERQIYMVAEQSYFEGQRDAINGDIRIQMSDSGVYHWSKSPWDTDREPIYQPTREDSQIKH